MMEKKLLDDYILFKLENPNDIDLLEMRERVPEKRGLETKVIYIRKDFDAGKDKDNEDYNEKVLRHAEKVIGYSFNSIRESIFMSIAIGPSETIFRIGLPGRIIIEDTTPYGINAENALRLFEFIKQNKNDPYYDPEVYKKFFAYEKARDKMNINGRPANLGNLLTVKDACRNLNAKETYEEVKKAYYSLINPSGVERASLFTALEKYVEKGKPHIEYNRKRKTKLLIDGVDEIDITDAPAYGINIVNLLRTNPDRISFKDGKEPADPRDCINDIYNIADTAKTPESVRYSVLKAIGDPSLISDFFRKDCEELKDIENKSIFIDNITPVFEDIPEIKEGLNNLSNRYKFIKFKKDIASNNYGKTPKEVNKNMETPKRAEEKHNYRAEVDKFRDEFKNRYHENINGYEPQRIRGGNKDE